MKSPPKISNKQQPISDVHLTEGGLLRCAYCGIELVYEAAP
jgi:hypothetical protein